jgi:hypothetical protein
VDHAGLSALQELLKEPISKPPGSFSISVNNSLLIATTWSAAFLTSFL